MPRLICFYNANCVSLASVFASSRIQSRSLKELSVRSPKMDNPKHDNFRFGHPTTNLYQKSDEYWDTPQYNDHHHHQQQHYQQGGFGGIQQPTAYQNDYRLYPSFDYVNEDAQYHSSREFFNKTSGEPSGEYIALAEPALVPKTEPESEKEDYDSDNSTTSDNTRNSSDPDYDPDFEPKPKRARQSYNCTRESSVSSNSTVSSLVQAIKEKKPPKLEKLKGSKPAARKRKEFVPKARGYKPKSQEEKSDPGYQARRAKNNDAVRKSRYKAKVFQESVHAENAELKKKLKESEEKIQKLEATIRALRNGTAH
ncbi:unnamed protein product [Caenorhabditis brenneri]